MLTGPTGWGETDVILHVTQIYSERHDQGSERVEPGLGPTVGPALDPGAGRHGSPGSHIDLRSAERVRSNWGGGSSVGGGTPCAEARVWLRCQGT